MQLVLRNRSWTCAGRVSARTFSRLELPAIVSVSGDRVAEVQDAGRSASSAPVAQQSGGQ